ncbi:MAG: sarcosine oxidase subunit gamma [Rhodobacterales bacterium]|nr:MAG: sarcosine oxidase subunit gamma [Rhodobacterales bacterium]
MSDRVSALPGAEFDGYCTVRDAGRVGMVTIRGDLADSAFTRAVSEVTGCALPKRRGIAAEGGCRLAWMAPDELMLFCKAEDAPAQARALTEAFGGQHALAVDVTDARAVVRVEGGAVREVIAKLTPADVSPEAFGPGQMRRTRLGQVPAAFSMPDETSFEVIGFRSVAIYLFDLLANAAKPGSEVGLFGHGR